MRVAAGMAGAAGLPSREEQQARLAALGLGRGYGFYEELDAGETYA